MIKLSLLHNNYLVHILTKKENKRIEIKNGIIDGNKYHTLIINNSSVFAEGDNNITCLIADSLISMYLMPQTLISKIAKMLNDESIEITKEIPEGKEKEILYSLLEK